jgi:SAM-dependent methyltransferase
MPIASHAYDSALCAEVLEHVDPERVVAEINRVLKPGGTVVLTMPFIPFIHADPDDYQRYTPAKLERLLSEADFVVELIEPQGYFFGTLADLVQRGLSQVEPWALRATAGIAFLPVLMTLEWLDGRAFVARGSFLRNVSTGFLVIATKAQE